MNGERLFSIRNPWFVASAGVTASVVVVSAVMGFVVLPSLQPGAGLTGMWDAICRAAGSIRTSPAEPGTPAGFVTSDVVVTPQMLSTPDAVSVGRGATLAMQCTLCHGSRGLSEAESPNLAGQHAAVVYKQLKDYQSGARVSAIMTPRVAGLDDQDFRDLAAYYAYLPRLPGYHPDRPPQIVESGAPMRNIAPCASCHGDREHKAGSAWLEGESPIYLKAQLLAFASGARHNDISQQMRNIARRMTPAEIDAAAEYYGSHP